MEEIVGVDKCETRILVNDQKLNKIMINSERNLRQFKLKKPLFAENFRDDDCYEMMFRSNLKDLIPSFASLFCLLNDREFIGYCFGYFLGLRRILENDEENNEDKDDNNVFKRINWPVVINRLYLAGTGVSGYEHWIEGKTPYMIVEHNAEICRDLLIKKYPGENFYGRNRSTPLNVFTKYNWKLKKTIVMCKMESLRFDSDDIEIDHYVEDISFITEEMNRYAFVNYENKDETMPLYREMKVKRFLNTKSARNN